MVERELIGNNVLEADGDFAPGYANGTLYYYDTNCQLPRPFTSKAIYAFMMENLADLQTSAEWNAGFVFGWITAFCENNPTFFFTSILHVVTEPLPTISLQEA